MVQTVFLRLAIGVKSLLLNATEREGTALGVNIKQRFHERTIYCVEPVSDEWIAGVVYNPPTKRSEDLCVTPAC